MIGGYPLYPVNHFTSFKECLEEISVRYADCTALVEYTPEGIECSHTYASFGGDVKSLVASLMALGLEGKHIALVAENSYRWVVSLFAITTLGSVSVNIDTEQSADTIKAMVSRADAEAVICSFTFLPMFLARQGSSGGLKHIILLNGEAEKGVLSYDTLVQDGRLRAWMCDRVTASPDQPAVIVYTSGTTNISKPVLLSHRNLLANACYAASMTALGRKVFVPLPLYHTYAFTAGLMPQIVNGRVACLNGSLKTMMRDLLLFSPTSVAAVPLVVEALFGRIRAEVNRRGGAQTFQQFLSGRKPSLQRAPSGIPEVIRQAVEAVFGPEIKHMISGGAYLNPDICDAMTAMGIQIIEGYGITECSPVVSVSRNEAHLPHSAGLIMPETEVRIVDGEIWVRGVSVAMGYYKDEELTAQCFQNGWFMTGDLGAIDKNGFLTINGRKKTLIVFNNGKKVTPEEIEQYMQEIPLVQEAMVYGMNVGSSEDEVKLAMMVYPNPEFTQGMDAYEILRKLQEEVARVNRNLPTYKQVQAITIKDTPFEKTALKKIKRHTV